MGNRTTHDPILNRVWAMVVALALLCVGFHWSPAARAESDGMLRVLLTRLGTPSSLTLRTVGAYYLSSDPEIRLSDGDTATVSAEGGSLTLTIDGTRVSLGSSDRLIRADQASSLRFIRPELSNRFCGDLWLSASEGVITAILNLYVEDYLYGVVGYAMPPSSGVEALKAMAVALRTQALRRKSQRGDSAYDLTDGGDWQFKGLSTQAEYKNVLDAVDDSRGGVLVWGDQLIQCGICLSNGGQTEESKNAGGPELPYSRVQDDPWDLASPTAMVKSATVNRDLTGIDERLYAALTDGVRAQMEANDLSDTVESFQLRAIESITACESRFPSPSRLYKSLTFKMSVSGRDLEGQERVGTVSVSIPTYGAFEDWYDLSINSEDNETVWVTEDDRAFTVSFRRQGAGVGLSVRGAQVMAEQHMKAADILKFYFPGVEGKRLELSQALQIPSATSAVAVATARLTARTDLMDAPDPAGVAIATAAAGAVVAFYDADEQWAQVGFGGRVGYVPASQLESVSLSGEDVTDAAEDIQAASDGDLLMLPASGSARLGAIRAGETLRVVARGERWAQVRRQEETGFVDISVIGPAEAPEATEAPGAEDSFVEAEGEVYARLKHDAPLFEYPNALSAALTTLRQGDRVQVLAYSREWARVRTNRGREGCVRQEALNADSQEDQAAIEGGDVNRVKGRRYMYISAGSAQFYERWSTDSRVLDQLLYGERVQLGAYNEAWACVRFEGVIGYVRMEALTDERPEAPAGGDLIRVGEGAMGLMIEDATAYGAPDGALKVMTLQSGQRVALVACNESWVVVRVDGVMGYVARQAVKLD